MSDDRLTAELRFESDEDLSAHWDPTGLIVTERFNEPYEMRVELKTFDLAAEPSELLGKSVSLFIERETLSHELSGIVERIEEGATSAHDLFCTVTVVPALRALAHRKTSRIFQDMTIPEVLEAVLSEGLGAYDREANLDGLAADYPPQEYTVQYRETDLDFASRLMEAYGISYYFKSEEGKEVLYLTDDDSSYTELVSLGNDEGFLPMRMRDGTPEQTEDARGFRRESKLRSTVARTQVWDWISAETKPSESEASADLDSPNGAIMAPEREDYDHEMPADTYGYRTDGLDTAALDSQIELRRERHQRDAVRCWGVSVATQMTTGSAFELLDHPQADLQGRYVTVAVTHMAGVFMTGEDGTETYINKFHCVPEGVAWRPARTRRGPRTHGVQTATVVGPSGEEIYTDEHGRIKVQFHWDRDGGHDENTTCFMRVIQPWAGNGWGFVFLPRIGMEVAVTFIEGDPDRPIVTGCVYNGANPPPYALPDDKTKSTIKTESSPGGGGFNELRFEDAAGSEEIYIHAQKDFNEEVLNDHNTTVGNNQTNTVDVDQTQTVHGNQVEQVDGDQTMTVDGNRTVHVKGDYTETVDGTETRTVTGDVSETFAANETRTITGDITETISGSVTHTISGDQTDTVTGSLTETIVGGITTTTPGNLNVTAAGGINMTTSGSMLVTATGGFTVLAPGGTKTVDVSFWQVGGGQGDAFSWQIGLCAAKLDLVEVAVGVTSLKTEANGVVFSATGFESVKGGAEMKTTGNKIEMGVAALFSVGLLSIA